MRGADVLIQSLINHRVQTIFGNPGTTENSLLDRLGDYPQLAYYVALHESVAVAAATYYAQASGNLAAVNLHVAPGLGNAIGMMYGALKANAPMLVTAGQQDTRMRLSEPLLSHDLVAMAAPVCKFSAEPRTADEIAPLVRRAIRIALEAPRGPVFIGLPVDVMEQTTATAPSLPSVAGAVTPAAATIEQAAAMLIASYRPCIITGDDPARDGAFDQVVTLAEAMGAPVYNEGLRAQLSFPSRHPNYRGRVPYTHGEIAPLLADHDLIILLGGPFFENIWYDDQPPFPPAAKLLQLENNATRLGFNFTPDLGVVGHFALTLDALLEAFANNTNDAYRAAAAARNHTLAGMHDKNALRVTAELDRVRGTQPMNPLTAMHELAAALPPEAVIVDESITNFPNVTSQFDLRRPGDWFGGRGGGIGQGIAGALGTQVALPQRRVVAISGDGSAMYSIQALWSAAHHALPILFVILANREYRVLKHNLDTYRTRFDADSEKPYPFMDLMQPALGFVEMAAGMGVAGARIENAAEIGPAVATALAGNMPYLLELVVAGKGRV